MKVNTQILKLEPDNLPALTRRGLCYLNLGKYPAAREDLSRALRLYPQSSMVKEALRKIERGWDAALERERQLPEERRRRAREKESSRREAEEARRRTEEGLRAVEQVTDFDEAYTLGVAASKGSPPNYAVAIAAFRKAYRLDTRRKVRSGRKPDPGLFEVPTRLAAAYRLNGQRYEAQKMYEWVLERHDNRFARVGLAAVHEDSGKHVQALKLYESVLADDPHNAYALRGVARTLGNLGRGEEAIEAYRKTSEASR